MLIEKKNDIYYIWSFAEIASAFYVRQFRNGVNVVIGTKTPWVFFIISARTLTNFQMVLTHHVLLQWRVRRNKSFYMLLVQEQQITTACEGR